MKRIYGIILLVICMTMFGSIDVNAAENSNENKHQTSLSKQEQPQSALFDTRDVYRICNARPQRILPTYGSGQNQGWKYSFQCKINVVNLIYFYENAMHGYAPFSYSASSDYYVIALRRILC